MKLSIKPEGTSDLQADPYHPLMTLMEMIGDRFIALASSRSWYTSNARPPN